MPAKILLSCRAAAFFTLALVIVFMILSPGKAAAFEGENLALRVLVDGQEVVFPDARPFIDANGRTQAPARFVAQALGAAVNWNAGAATFSGNGIDIILTPGSATAAVNGASVALDSAAVLREDRVYVPVRFIAETMGAGVQWDAEARTVQIITLAAQPEIKNFGITHTGVDAGWYRVPRTFTAWVEAGHTQKVDFYLKPTGTGQEPVKIATTYGIDGDFRIAYRLPQTEVRAHFWAVAVNERGEQSTDILNVYRAAGAGQESIEFGALSINGYNQDLFFAPGGGRAVFSGYSYPDEASGEENTGITGKLLLLDVAAGAVNILDEGESIRAVGWDPAGENLLYVKDGALYRLSMLDGRKNIIAADTSYGVYSPDGRQIAFTPRNNGLWVCDAYGNNQKRLTETTQDWYPVWYPDSRHLFYFSDLGQELGDGAGHLQGMAKISVADGGIETILPQMTGKFRRAAWIAPGRSLHVVSGWDDGHEEHIVDLVAGKIIDLGENLGQMNFVTAVDAASGRLCQASAAGIKIYGTSGELLDFIEHHPGGRPYLSAAFAPGGQRILFMCGTQSTGPAPVAREIAVLDLVSGRYEVLTAGGENFEACCLDPGSGQILLLEKSAAGMLYELVCFTKIDGPANR